VLYSEHIYKAGLDAIVEFKDVSIKWLGLVLEGLFVGRVEGLFVGRVERIFVGRVGRFFFLELFIKVEVVFISIITNRFKFKVKIIVCGIC
jgi:hypothetical protein